MIVGGQANYDASAVTILRLELFLMSTEQAAVTGSTQARMWMIEDSLALFPQPKTPV
ncbi:hypothetical protein ACFL5Z_05300 [Planctomycetota bacterium]